MEYLVENLNFVLLGYLWMLVETMQRCLEAYDDPTLHYDILIMFTLF